MRLPLPGFVYVSFNPAVPELVKIGRRHLQAKTRAPKRSKARAQKGFRVAHEEWVGDAAAVERRLLGHFAKRRVARRPGVFRVPLKEAVKALKATGGRARKGRNFLRFQPAGLSKVRVG